MDNLYSDIVMSLEKKERMALATLIHRVGSAPRAVGAKYLVKEDGTSSGTIGGGCVEAEVWQRAQEVIKKEEAGVLHFDLTAEQLAAGGLICGGRVDIFVEPLREDFLDIYREMDRIKRKGGSAILATVVSAEPIPAEGEGGKILLKSSGERIGRLFNEEELIQDILAAKESVLRENKPRLISVTLEREKLEILVEPVFSEPTVYIFGGGHISQQLAPLVKTVHFKVVVIDDREMFANRNRFPEADEVLVGEFEKCFDRMTIDESSYIVIVTRGHLYDGVVLEQAVRSKARYIGMIGSRHKIQMLYRNLVDHGIPREALNRVHAPIGLEINSETPEEIAVSITAELIQVRGGVNG